MSLRSSSALLQYLNLLSEPIRDALARADYAPPGGTNDSIKSLLLSLLPPKGNSQSGICDSEVRTAMRDFSLCCAALAAASNSASDKLSWISGSLSAAANSAFNKMSDAYYDSFHGGEESVKIGEMELDFDSLANEKRLVIDLMPEVLPLLKDKIKESSIDTSDEMSAASARVPVAYAIVAAYQFRWFTTQVDYPYLGRLCALVVPCALTTLDHWSSDVKGQGMTCFIHLAKNVNATEISWYEDVILDACCQNIACSDEIWQHVVEMSVLLVSSTQRSNPRSQWYERLLNEMLNHLERQPRNKERRDAWLRHIEPLLSSVGLILLAHFRRIFPLFFRWMHADDDDTVILVLERVKTILRLTWIRNSPYAKRLVDELFTLHKEAALKIAREDIRSLVLQTLILMQKSMGSEFEAAWDKHKEDPDLIVFHKLFTRTDAVLGLASGKAWMKGPPFKWLGGAWWALDFKYCSFSHQPSFLPVLRGMCRHPNCKEGII